MPVQGQRSEYVPEPPLAGRNSSCTFETTAPSEHVAKHNKRKASIKTIGNDNKERTAHDSTAPLCVALVAVRWAYAYARRARRAAERRQLRTNKVDNKLCADAKAYLKLNTKSSMNVLILLQNKAIQPNIAIVTGKSCCNCEQKRRG